MPATVETAIYRLKYEGLDDAYRAAQALGQVTVAEEELTKATRASAASFERQLAAIDPNIRAYQQYQRTLEQVSRYEAAGIGTAQQRVALIEGATRRYAEQVTSLKGVDDSNRRLVSGMSTLGKANLDAITASQRLIQGMSAARSANDNFSKSTGLARHEMINLGRQVQDVGTMVALGASPFSILASQGAQVADIFASSQGSLKGFATQAREALTSFLTPGRAIVIGFAAATAAAYGLYRLLRTEQPTIEQNLEEHARLLGVIKSAYGEAFDAAGRFYSQSREQTVFQTIQNIERLRTNLRDLTTEMTKASTAPTSIGMPEMGIGPDPSAIVAQERFKEFADAINRLQDSIRAGNPDFMAFNRTVSEIGTSNPALRESAGRLLDISKSAADMAQKVQVAEATLRLLQGTATEADRTLLNLAGTINKVDMGRIREQNAIQLKALTAFSPSQKGEIAFLETKLRLQDQVNRKELTEAEQIEQANAARLLAQQGVLVSLQEARRERELSSRQSLEAAQLETQLVGKSIGEQERLRGEQQIRHQLEQEAARNRTAFNEKEFEELKRNNAERAKAVEQQQFLIDILQQTGAAAGQFFNTFLQGLTRGDGLVKSLIGSLGGLGNTLQSVGSRMVGTQLGNLFTPGGTVDVQQLGAGASLSLLGAGISGVLNNMQRRQQRQQDLAQAQQESRRRVQDLQFQRQLVGIDTGTLSGALSAFDIQTQQQLGPLTKSAGGFTVKTDEARAYEELRAAERLALIKQFNDREIAEEKRRQRELESLRMDFADREFAAINDNSTLAGRLAEFDRAGVRERLELAETAAELIPDLERAQAAERLRIQRDFNDESVAQAKQAAQELLAANNQAARGVVQYLNSLLAGPNSALSPTAQLQATQQAFSSQLALAQAGNVDAAGSITQFAESYRVAAQNRYGSGTQYQQVLDQIRNSLLALPQVTQSTDPVVQSLAQVIQAIEEQTGVVETGNTLMNTNNTLVTTGNTLSGDQKALLDLIKASAATTVTNTDLTADRTSLAATNTLNTANRIGGTNSEGLRGLTDVIRQNVDFSATMAGYLEPISERSNEGWKLFSMPIAASGGGSSLVNTGIEWDKGDNNTPPRDKPFALGGIATPGMDIMFGEHHPRGPFFGTVGRDPIAITPGLPPQFAGNDNSAMVAALMREVVALREEVRALREDTRDAGRYVGERVDINTANRSHEAGRTRQNDSINARKRGAA